MKVRLAVAAAVLALSVSAFTPTPTAAAGPTGVVICSVGDNNPPQDNFIAFPSFGPTRTVGEAILNCLEHPGGGRPIGIVFD